MSLLLVNPLINRPVGGCSVDINLMLSSADFVNVNMDLLRRKEKLMSTKVYILLKSVNDASFTCKVVAVVLYFDIICKVNKQLLHID